ncbi:hypothetical protein NEUTE1DRAFT_139633 [Neurospora tetrasperma FGSC 2508]|uniref:Uncharacterized protein n=1 Tax=Neurospora tetrasperma (strain FGSC 2508 / ATCC MYA-4615 / P0657) TaxID=510951 RepID=F8MTN4_NEUT8|nr:uncharacterized protein NEUTE1DRAFT_139633 [Neurospora tetrasperma FGSC 2508]EGO55366.1 hypothetical protein NEUTE1DRAFT_139633 [Neurospora tetrasperma FGSC 2508]
MVTQKPETKESPAYQPSLEYLRVGELSDDHDTDPARRDEAGASSLINDAGTGTFNG